jgi:hypothetical protein
LAKPWRHAYTTRVRDADRDRIRRYVQRLDEARRTLAGEISDDVDPVRGLSVKERGDWIASVCRSAWAILASRPDAERVIGMREDPAPDFRAKWTALMALRRRRSGSAS